MVTVARFSPVVHGAENGFGGSPLSQFSHIRAKAVSSSRTARSPSNSSEPECACASLRRMSARHACSLHIQSADLVRACHTRPHVRFGTADRYQRKQFKGTLIWYLYLVPASIGGKERSLGSESTFVRGRPRTSGTCQRPSAHGTGAAARSAAMQRLGQVARSDPGTGGTR